MTEKKSDLQQARHVFAQYFISQLHQQVIGTADKILCSRLFLR